MKWLAAVVLVFLFSWPVHAQASASGDRKINDLVILLQDPDTQIWLESRKTTTPSVTDIMPGSAFLAWQARTRAQVDVTAAAFPRTPSEIRTAGALTRADATSHSDATVFAIFGGLIAVGIAAEWPCRKYRSCADGTAAGQVPGMPTYIRHMAHMRIREAFRANGIEFALPMVNVGGEEKDGGTAAAAATIKAQQVKAAATGT